MVGGGISVSLLVKWTSANQFVKPRWKLNFSGFQRAQEINNMNSAVSWFKTFEVLVEGVFGCLAWPDHLNLLLAREEARCLFPKNGHRTTNLDVRESKAGRNPENSFRFHKIRNVSVIVNAPRIESRTCPSRWLAWYNSQCWWQARWCLLDYRSRSGNGQSATESSYYICQHSRHVEVQFPKARQVASEGKKGVNHVWVPQHVLIKRAHVERISFVRADNMSATTVYVWVRYSRGLPVLQPISEIEI